MSSLVGAKLKNKVFLPFCNEKIHPVLKLTEDVEKNHGPDIWQGYHIYHALHKIAGISRGS